MTERGWGLPGDDDGDRPGGARRGSGPPGGDPSDADWWSSTDPAAPSREVPSSGQAEVPGGSAASGTAVDQDPTTGSPSPQQAHEARQTRPGSRRRRVVVASAAASVVVVAVLAGLVNASRDDTSADPSPSSSTTGGSSPTPAPTPEPSESETTDRARPTPSLTPEPSRLEATTVWAQTAAAVDPTLGAASSFGGQSEGVGILATDTVWVVGLDRETWDLGAVVGLDPATGAQVWRHDLGTGLCTDSLEQGRLACLREEAGSPALEVVSAESGAVESYPTTLAAPDLDIVRALHPTAAGLLVLHAAEADGLDPTLSLIGWDGATVWAHSFAGVKGVERLYSPTYIAMVDGSTPPARTELQPVFWRNLAGGRTAMLSSGGLVMVDLATGPLGPVQSCWAATVTDDAYFCSTGTWDPAAGAATSVQRYDHDGTLRWSTPDVQLMFTAYPWLPFPVAAQGRSLVALDLATGAVGAELVAFPDVTPLGYIHSASLPKAASADGGALGPITLAAGAEDTLVRLAPDGSVLWRVPHTEPVWGRPLVTVDAAGEPVLVMPSIGVLVYDLDDGALRGQAFLGGTAHSTPAGLATAGAEGWSLVRLP